MRTQAELGEAFKSLHERDGAFIIPNPWDSRVAITGLVRAAEEMLERGTFSFGGPAIPHSEINARFAP